MGNTHLVIRAVDLFSPVLTWLKIYMNRLIFLFFRADRDYKETVPYSDVKINQWNEVGHAKVYLT